ncbi:hypothetical protein H0O00_02040, partial [Candidatus Micrarchaeota archaeon]|nr:hypothetical protein [Candidatus Micrarchaeota archaeon]
MRWGIVSAFVLLLLSLSFSAYSTEWTSPSFRSCLYSVDDAYLDGSHDCTMNCMAKSYGIWIVTDMIRTMCLSDCLDNFPFSRINAKVYDYNPCVLGCFNLYANAEYAQCSIASNGEWNPTIQCYLAAPSAKSLGTCMTGCQDGLGVT